MNNFYLLNEALSASSISELENGILSLNDISIQRNALTDALMKHESIWEYNIQFGRMVELYYSIVSKELQRLVPKVFESFQNYPEYLSNEIEFDLRFPDECNGFVGVNFQSTTIPISRQITDVKSFNLFKVNCVKDNAYNSFDNFWESREILFPNLIFCNNVHQQISHFSLNDDRFKLINDKLKKLDGFAGKWNNGTFEFNKMGLDCSPDTPSRIANTLSFRTFRCPDDLERIFSLHIKWYFGGEPFRLYFYPDPNTIKVYIGYIGPKDDIGF